MNLQQLLNLNLNPFEIEYALSETDVIFLLRLLDDDFKRFAVNCSYELHFAVTEEENLHIYIDCLHNDIKTRIGLEIPVSEKQSNDICQLYNIFSSGNIFKLILFSNNAMEVIELKLYNHDLTTFNNWINNKTIKPEESYTFNNNYKNVPIGYLIPQKSNTCFWFVSKLTDDNYNIAKENINDLIFKADIFEGELVLYLAFDKNLLSVIQLENSIIDESIQNDFKLLIAQDSVSFLLNTEDKPDSNILNINLNLDTATKERIKHYLSI